MERQEIRDRALIVEGDISRAVLRLAGPAIASLLLQTTFTVVDTIWVGRLGAPALAALSTAGFVVWSIQALAQMLSVGVNALVARAAGAADWERSRYIAGQGLIVAVALSLVVAGLGLPSVEGIFRVMGTDSTVTRLGTSYLTILLWGVVSPFLLVSAEAIFRGNGDTRTPMRVLIGAVLLNAVLDPFLIFGWGPFPRWGVAGAAVATVVSQLTGALWAFALLGRRRLVALRGRDASRPQRLPLPDIRLAGRIAAIGAPIAASGFLFCVVYVLLTRITTRFGTEAVAALGIGHRGEALAYMTSVGFAAAASAMVGQNLGAGRPQRAEQAAWRATLFISIVTGLWGIVLLAVPEGIVRVFSADPEVIRIGASYLRILAVSEVFMGWEIVLEGAFGGAGNTIPPMAITMPLSVARIPAAYLLAYRMGLGISGVWWAISLSSICKGLLMALWFRRRRWMR